MRLTTTLTITLALAAALAIGIAAYRLAPKSEVTVDVSRAAVIKEMRELGRFETASFSVEKIIEASTGEKNAFSSILFGDKILLVASGEVIAGLDMTKLADNALRIDGRDATLTLPPPEILVSRLNNGQTKVYDRRRGLLTQGDKDLESKARDIAEQQIRAAACDAHLLDQASANAKKQLGAMFAAIGFSSVAIEVPAGECK